MGALFGGYLSRENEVYLIDINRELVEMVNQNGVQITEPDGTVRILSPQARTDAAGLGRMDLVIVFVKSMFSHAALETNRDLIGPDTYLMTLQNGSGHEATLLDFVSRDHVIIGTTQHNSAVSGLGAIRHGGSGATYIGSLEGDSARLQPIADTFTACGLSTACRSDVQRLIWEKLFTNVSASVLTAVLQMPLGYISEEPHAWSICERLIREAVDVANGDGMKFNAEEKIDEVRKVCCNSPKGLTSIYADLRDGRRSEVDTISGSVVQASRRNGVPAPGHELMVQLVHALEQRPRA